MIGSLLYLTASRPNIAFVVGVCARYQEDPKTSHINQVKRILKYVNGTCEYGMLYSHGCEPILTGYCDADCAGSADDRKVLQEDVSSWGITSSHGSARNKIVYPYLLQRQNTLQQEVV